MRIFCKENRGFVIHIVDNFNQVNKNQIQGFLNNILLNSRKCYELQENLNVVQAVVGVLDGKFFILIFQNITSEFCSSCNHCSWIVKVETSNGQILGYVKQE
jgi:hypothetical protein